MLFTLSSPIQAQGTKGTVELWEGTVRQIFVDKPLVGARGDLVADLAKGQRSQQGTHEGPEDLGELMIECNGPIIGVDGIAPMELRVWEGKITVRPPG